ncbi:MAG TPA: carboxyl transferase domain-containing protein, partial [Actinomycetota bacterium]|nr:carboxyl transferase domain-containing protein [Actinomycetota bacterium]
MPAATVEDKIDELIKRKDHAQHAAGAEAEKKQHDRGKLTARERIELLLDPGSFVE